MTAPRKTVILSRGLRTSIVKVERSSRQNSDYQIVPQRLY